MLLSLLGVRRVLFPVLRTPVRRVLTNINKLGRRERQSSITSPNTGRHSELLLLQCVPRDCHRIGSHRITSHLISQQRADEVSFGGSAHSPRARAPPRGLRSGRRAGGGAALLGGVPRVSPQRPGVPLEARRPLGLLRQLRYASPTRPRRRLPAPLCSSASCCLLRLRLRLVYSSLAFCSLLLSSRFDCSAFVSIRLRSLRLRLTSTSSRSFERVSSSGAARRGSSALRIL